MFLVYDFCYLRTFFPLTDPCCLTSPVVSLCTLYTIEFSLRSLRRHRVENRFKGWSRPLTYWEIWSPEAPNFKKVPKTNGPDYSIDCHGYYVCHKVEWWIQMAKKHQVA